MKSICMNRISALIASSVFALTSLVACNGSTGSNTGSGATLAKAVCTSSANWNAVGIGMSLSDVKSILGQPTQITATSTSTVYTYDSCRGFVTAIDETTGQRTRTDVGGSVTWQGNIGVTAISSPERPAGTVLCEVDFYNYPIGTASPPCREANNPY